MKCNNDCLNCKFLVCKHDVADRKEYLERYDKLKEKEHHAKYYREHREAVLAKQKERDKNRSERSKRFYEKHKERLHKERHDRYWEHRDEYIEKQRAYYALHKDEINARRRERRKIKEGIEG